MTSQEDGRKPVVRLVAHPIFIHSFLTEPLFFGGGGQNVLGSSIAHNVHGIVSMGYKPDNELPPEVTGWPSRKETWQLFSWLFELNLSPLFLLERGNHPVALRTKSIVLRTAKKHRH